jgi:hypothetical protein
MSKKQLRNRLESLFEDLELDASLVSLPDGEPIQGWTWECDADGNFLSCGPEVLSILGVDCQDFIGQSLLSFGLYGSSSGVLEETLKSGTFPIEITLEYAGHENGHTVPVPVKVHITHANGDHEERPGLRGFVQVLEGSEAAPPEPPLPKPHKRTPTSKEPPRPSHAGWFAASSGLWPPRRMDPLGGCASHRGRPGKPA